MKYIKLFEDGSTETEISIPDVIEYFTKYGKVEKQELQDFILKLFRSAMVKFKCHNCTYDNEHGATASAHMFKTHKGKITGYGYGFQDEYGQKKMYLKFYLNRIKYAHEVETSVPIIIYGDLPSGMEKTVDEINMFMNVRKYNL